MSAFVALHEKNLSFVVEPVEISTHGTRSKAFVISSLTQRVPALKHSEFCYQNLLRLPYILTNFLLAHHFVLRRHETVL